MPQLKLVLPNVQEQAMIAAVKSIVATTCQERFSQEPVLKRNHIKWNEKYRMLARAKDKGFAEGALVSWIGLFLAERQITQNQPCGAIILYADEYYMRKLMSAAGLSGEDVLKQGAVADFCSELCNMITGQFINRVVSEGYQEIFMTSPDTQINEIPEGVKFNSDYAEYIEFGFFLWGKNVFSIDLTLSAIFKNE
ncbi:MAG TPA: chemotaxis protein CheX [Candidatus Omnitrophota bacterium]|nr:chemotaxis protein CheX [Candidatus Omnitrophota bacterium]HQO58891.1 chemotaxis protein CheX [Candidatus Omnitrophota bacterium]